MASFEALASFDWTKATNAQFLDLFDEFQAWAASQPTSDVKLADGWHSITPDLARRILMRNRKNRRVAFSTVAYYARQMLANDWPETGQPIIFTVHGDLGDAQHRLWACLLSGATFPSYVVNQRKDIPNVFAYIDNARSRSSKDALQTAGHDGQAGVMAMTIQIALNCEAGAYTPSKKYGVPKRSPAFFISYAETHPKLSEAVNLMAGEHSDAAKVIHHADVAAYVAFQILTLHDEFTLDQFMSELGTMDPTSSAVMALQTVMKSDRASIEPMKKHQVLGYVIKAFNFFMAGKVVRKLTLDVKEDFPEFNPPASAEAAQ